jgi:hypothetical protein
MSPWRLLLSMVALEVGARWMLWSDDVSLEVVSFAIL